MSATDELVTRLIDAGMTPGDAALLVARAAVEAAAQVRVQTPGAARTARWRMNRASHGDGEQPSQTVTNRHDVTKCDGDSPSRGDVVVPPSNGSPTPLPITTPSRTDGDSPRAREKRGTRLPADWTPSEEDRAFAIDEGLNGQRLDNAIAEFRDYWIGVGGRHGVKTNWPATWRNRVRALLGKAGHNNRSRAPPSNGGGFAAVLSDLHGRDNDGPAGSDDGGDGTGARADEPRLF